MKTQARSEDQKDNKMLRAGPGAEGQQLKNSLIFLALLVGTYLALNIALNMCNKFTLGIYNFKFPILLSMAHQAFSMLILGPLMATKSYREQHSTVKKQWQGLLAISAFFAFNLGCNNLSLVTISLSLNQVIRACIPVATAIGSVIFEGKTPTRQESISLVILVSGVGISVYEGNSKATAHGITLCILGTISNGFMMSCIGRLVSEKVDVLRLTFYTAPVTILMLVPFYWALEAKSFQEYQPTDSNSFYLVLIAIGCCLALSYNVVHSMVIKATSSVTTTVLGEMKIILLLVLSSIWLGESGIWNPKMLFGVITALLGFVLFSHAKLNTGPAPQYLPIIKGMPDLPSSLADSGRLKDRSTFSSL